MKYCKELCKGNFDGRLLYDDNDKKKIKKPNHTFSVNFVLEVIPWSILFLVTKGLKGQLEDLNSAIESPQNIAAERKQTTSESTKQPSDEQVKVRCCVMKCR